MGVAEHPARVVPQNSSIVAAVFLFITIISFQLGVRNFAPKKWGGAERDPGGAQRLTWFMAGQPRRRCDLLRFAEHPRCAGRSAEREHVRVARRQAPHPIEFHTGHDSSFHAISQNIHAYRELLMNASS